MQIVWIIRHGSVGSGNSKHWQVLDVDGAPVQGIPTEGLAISGALASAAGAAAALAPASRISSVITLDNMNGELLLLLDQV